MKTTKKFFMLFIMSFTVSSCTSVPMATSEKYNLDNQLENVRYVPRFNTMDWNRIDDQSFVLKTAPCRYYLVVLDRKSDESSIIVDNSDSTMNSIIWPGFNNITMIDNGWEETYSITKVYNLKDYNEVEAVKAQLLKGTTPK